MIGVWMSPATLERLAGSLLHFVWQGAAIALIAALALRLLRNRSAEWRYAAASAALVAMLLAPLVTFMFYAQTGALTLRLLRGLNEAVTRMASDTTSADVAIWTQRIVFVWLVGVAILLMRLLGGWLLSRRLVRAASLVVAPVVTNALQRARAGLNFYGDVSVLSGELVETPAVIGWLRPAILLPVSALTGLTAAQLLAIVAHELAHVRRHDFLVNGLQRVVECILFYHPAVWWMSGRIRLERERCCDDLAVGVCGDRVVYAQALVAIENARAFVPALALPSAGIGVADRVRRILGVNGANHDWQSAAAAVMFAAILVSAGTWQAPMLATPSVPVTAQPPATRSQSSPVVPAVTSVPSSPARALLAIATGKGVQPEGRAVAPQPAAASTVAQPTIAATREAAREKLGRLRVEYSAESFVKQAGEGDTIAVKTFLAAGMNINARGDVGYTAVMKAAETKQLETVQSLLAAGADPNLTAASRSPLAIAAVGGNLPMMKVLLAAGAQVDLKVGDGQETALIQAARTGTTPDAITLLLDNKASIEGVATGQSTPLLAAASNDQVDMVRTLLDRGANINARFGDESTALHHAVRFDRDLTQLLIEHGADVNAKSKDGSSPLLKALGQGPTASARATSNALLLIEHGADVNATSANGETALTIAVSQKLVPVVRALLDKGANPNPALKVPSGDEIRKLLTDAGAKP